MTDHPFCGFLEGWIRQHEDNHAHPNSFDLKVSLSSLC
jgi:hypothetical protein